MSLIQRRNQVQERLMRFMPRMWAYRLTVMMVK